MLAIPHIVMQHNPDRKERPIYEYMVGKNDAGEYYMLRHDRNGLTKDLFVAKVAPSKGHNLQELDVVNLLHCVASIMNNPMHPDRHLAMKTLWEKGIITRHGAAILNVEQTKYDRKAQMINRAVRNSHALPWDRNEPETNEVFHKQLEQIGEDRKAQVGEPPWPTEDLENPNLVAKREIHNRNEKVETLATGDKRFTVAEWDDAKRDNVSDEKESVDGYKAFDILKGML